MPNTPEKSFIPRQGTATKRRQGASRRVYLFTVICYLIIISTLLATAGVFLYGRLIDSQLKDEISKLDEAISVFSQDEMDKVRDFDIRLRQAHFRIHNSVSASSIFTALETATIRSVQISELVLERRADTDFSLIATIITDGFDSSIFQRGIFERNQVINSVTIENLTLGQEAGNDSDSFARGSRVSFTAKLEVPLAKVPYVPSSSNIFEVPEPELVSVSPTTNDDGTSTSSSALPVSPPTP